jgi:hypothetical protein
MGMCPLGSDLFIFTYVPSSIYFDVFSAMFSSPFVLFLLNFLPYLIFNQLKLESIKKDS